jgi:hypothetical protein
MVTDKTKVTTLNEILATRARAIFPYRINFEAVGYLNIDQMKWWCEETCQGIWRSETYHALYFQFSEERDATMFMLRWGTADGNKLK